MGIPITRLSLSRNPTIPAIGRLPSLRSHRAAACAAWASTSPPSWRALCVRST